ncbi:hypothetical protein BsWGS_23466 [Bradybaena similaris]
MSGKIVATAATLKSNTTMKSAATPPPPLPPSRTSTKGIPQYPAPKPPFCPKCGSEDVCTHQYEDIMVKQNDQELRQYEQLVTSQDPVGQQISDRLRKVEDNQMRLRSEFNDFRESMEQSIKSLHTSVRRVIEMNDSLDESMRESFAYLQSNMEKTNQQLLESSDHLGKQLLDVRRDLVSASKNQPLTSKLTNSDLDRQQQKTCTHILEWEVSNIDRMLTLRQNASSQSHMIGEADFKMICGAVCTKDGYMRIKVYGTFTHMPTDPRERKNGNFECTAFLVDKSGKRADRFVGKITGDFNTGNEWIVANVSVADIKTSGYTTSDANVNLKFVVDVSC